MIYLVDVEKKWKKILWFVVGVIEKSRIIVDMIIVEERKRKKKSVWIRLDDS